jgi:cbb3-type cytochrome oxidase maturation protein
MSVIVIMIPAAMLIAGLAVLAFARAAKHGQFDDLESPAHRMLHDDDAKR